MEIEIYTFEDENGYEVGIFSTQDPNEARKHGSRYCLKVIANTFTFEDSELVWDFTDSDSEDEEA